MLRISEGQHLHLSSSLRLGLVKYYIKFYYPVHGLAITGY